MAPVVTQRAVGRRPNACRSGLSWSVAARQKLWTARSCTGRHRFPQQGQFNFAPNHPLRIRNHGLRRSLVRLEAEAAGDDFLLHLGGAAEDRLDAAEPPEVTLVWESSGLVLSSVRRAPSGQRELRPSRGAIWAAITRHGIVWPRGSSPVRGVAPATTPNQRPRYPSRRCGRRLR